MALAWRYYRGEGVDPNPNMARSWFARAAEQGSSEAACQLGCMLMAGEGGPRGLAEGAALLERAAASGDCDDAEEAMAAIARGVAGQRLLVGAGARRREVVADNR